jgi:cyclopropane fatty-acyl-phospholipid synthase-like methyltransferase
MNDGGIDMEYPKSDYKEYPKTLDPDDLWGQVRRTVLGKPVTDQQIELIVAAIKDGLGMAKADYLLDLACGNGALSQYFFSECSGFLGSDFSDYLISVAKKNFERLPDFRFVSADAASYVLSEERPGRFTHVLCYGSFSFFSADDARTVLTTLRQRFTNVRRIFIGNLPDRDKAPSFYPVGKDYAAELDQNESQIGLWRSKQEMSMLAEQTGWSAQFRTMPESFFAAHYRYDVVLEPKS